MIAWFFTMIHSSLVSIAWSLWGVLFEKIFGMVLALCFLDIGEPPPVESEFP